MTTTQCSVCIENFTKIQRRPIDCPGCDFSVCKECVQKFILSTPNEPQCMNCKAAWTFGFVCKNTSHAFVNGPFKDHRKQTMWERELSQMPQTQAAITEEKEAKLELTRLEMEYNAIDQERQRRISEIHAEYRIKTVPLKNQIQNFRIKKTRKAPTRSNFIRRCSDEECRGFLSQRWKCGLCDKKTCKDCLQCITGDDHECNDDDVETAKLLAEDTKPCPGCAVMITKINGCDQMWCPSCHVAFSWRHGTIDTGTNHNPHYYQHLRAQTADGVIPRDAGRVRNAQQGQGCLPDIVDLLPGTYAEHQPYVCAALRLAAHISGASLVYGRYAMPQADDGSSLRKDYLVKKISEEKFTSLVFAKQKATDVVTETRLVLTMFRDVVGDILTKVVRQRFEGGIGLADFATAQMEIEGVVGYANEAFTHIHKSYKVSGLVIDANLSLARPGGATVLFRNRIR